MLRRITVAPYCRQIAHRDLPGISLFYDFCRASAAVNPLKFHKFTSVANSLLLARPAV